MSIFFYLYYASCFSLWFTLFIAVEAFRQTDTDYLNEEKGQPKDAGSTATTAVLVGDRLLVANVGDSRVVACRAGLGLFVCLLKCGKYWKYLVSIM